MNNISLKLTNIEPKKIIPLTIKELKPWKGSKVYYICEKKLIIKIKTQSFHRKV